MHGSISLIIGLALGFYNLLCWDLNSLWVTIVLSAIAALAIWYAIDRVMAVKYNKLSFFEEGMVIQNGRTTTTVMLADIKSYRTTIKDSLVVAFTLHNETVVSLDSDDYADLSDSLEYYGRKVNFEIRTKF